MAILSLIASLALAVASYRFNMTKALDEAKTKGNIVFNYMKSSRDFFKTQQLPAVYEAAGRDEFIPVLMSSFAVVRGVFESFSKTTPDYYFKQATKNPLVPSNKADKQELNIIRQFQDNQKMTSSEGLIRKNGQLYYYFAQPIRVKKESCLECHGDPRNASDEQLDIYGEKNGYNWKLGETVSALIVYIPMQDALDQAKKLAGALFLIGTAGIILLMLILWFFFSRYVVKPLVILEGRATDISLGKNLTESIDMGSRDEIGSLGRAIDRLRISINKLLERYN
jgi:methyl-accepting chemotaxis protein